MDIYFWFDYPPKVEKGAFNAFSKLWKGNVYYVFDKDLRDERKLAKWDDGNFGDAEIIQLFEEHTSLEKVLSEIQDFDNTIHVFNGFETTIVKKIKPYLFRNGLKALLFTERPAIMGNLLERFVRKLKAKYKYSKLYKEYKPYVQFILPLGKQGMHRFQSYGVEANKMYNFMYCPQIEMMASKEKEINTPVKFLYVGRFYFKTKGTDVLMKATKLLSGDWSLDMVGGYGSNTEEVLRQINQNPHINYEGVWDSTQVVSKMQDYDVVIVPSKADGWNLCVNEAIHAGIAVIASDQAVSNELVDQSNCGDVFESGSYKELARKMQQVIDNPKLASQWSINGQAFVNRISCDTVGHYLFDIINFEFLGIGERPQCPWC